jgi:hypothetical protein
MEMSLHSIYIPAIADEGKDWLVTRQVGTARVELLLYTYSTQS